MRSCRAVRRQYAMKFPTGEQIADVAVNLFLAFMAGAFAGSIFNCCRYVLGM